MTQTDLRPPVAQRRTGAARAWLLTFLLVVFLFINYADKAVLAFAGVRIQSDLGISPEQFGLVQSAFFWLFAAGALTLGAVSQRIGLRLMLGILMLVWVASMVPLLGTVSFSVLLVSRLVLGFAEGPAYALATLAVHGWFPAEKRALPAGLVTAGASLGPLVGAPVLTWVIVEHSWHTAFGVLIVMGLIWAAAWFTFAKVEPAPAVEAAATVARPTVPNASYAHLLRTGTVIGIGLLLFLGYWSTSLKVAWLPVYLTDGLGYDTITSGRLMMIPYGVAAAGSIAAGFYSNRLVARGYSLKVARGYLAGGLIIAAGVAMFAFTQVDRGIVQMALITIAFSANTGAYAVGFTAVADVVHPSKRGQVLGGLVATSSIAGIISPLVMGFSVGAAADKITGYGFGFAVTGIVMAVGSAMAMFLVNPERDVKKLTEATDAAARDEALR